jgi:glucosamine--fructose-6-phosphate aminotransferase (isomerizing)
MKSFIEFFFRSKIVSNRRDGDVGLALARSEDSISRAHMRKEIMQSLLELPNQVRKALELDQQMLALAAELKEEQSLLLFGRGYNYATALEGALKVIRA